MTSTQIHALFAVLGYGGFIEASKRLYMAQPAVSQTTSVLGEELRVDIIIHEHRRDIQLSPTRSRIVSHLQTIVSEINVMKETTEQKRQDSARTLRAGCLPSAYACISPDIIHYFEQHHPHIKIIPYEENSTTIVDSLYSGDIDVGFVHSLVNGTYYVPVCRDKFTVIVPESHPLAANDTISVEQLIRESLTISKGRYELSIMALFKEKGAKPVIKYESNHPDTAMSFIRQESGIALSPGLTLRTVGGKVRSVVPELTFY